jgi:predicted phage baseplate assembly protein
MALPVPKLDDRTFQDLVREARAMIPRYCPKWTDHNLSDPGITLIELFAWMVETLLYRLNKVPDKNYVKFMELIGVRLAPASHATAEVTFRLSAPQPSPVVIPAGTEVATVRTETEDAITFTTGADLKIEVPTIQHFLITHDGVNFVEFIDELGRGKPVDLFRQVPEEGNAFYLGFSQPLAGSVLFITLDCVTAKGTGVNPEDPPLAWEYWDGIAQNWEIFQRVPEALAYLERDGTAALNRASEVVLHVPRTSVASTVSLRQAHWVRCRVCSPRTDQPLYTATPALTEVATTFIGGSVPAIHCARIAHEELGRSDGNPAQDFVLENSPILDLNSNETVEVRLADGQLERWQRVQDFSQSGPEDKHFVCDPNSGRIRFGPSIRQTSGNMKQHGSVPPAGSLITMSGYRYGGGTLGNVGKNTLTVLKSSIPYVASVKNRRAASGGTDQESIEEAKLRAPRMFVTRHRAVTESDFEFLALQASSGVGRAKCIQPREVGLTKGPPPGVVLVLIIPAVATVEGRIPRDQLDVPLELKSRVQTYLSERRLLTSLVVVSEPTYLWVSTEARVRVKPNFEQSVVLENIEAALYRYINPLFGGSQANGWPFGRDLIVSDIYSRIQSVDGVDYVEEASIYPVDISTGERGEAKRRLTLDRTAVLCSFEHHVLTAQD